MGSGITGVNSEPELGYAVLMEVRLYSDDPTQRIVWLKFSLEIRRLLSFSK
jgi:hypothetical protein